MKIIGVSVDPLESHQGWVGDIEETQGAKLNFPLIADPEKKVADLYDMIHPNANDTLTVRSVFVIGPDKKVKLIITYPASTGRNIDEILRVIDSLQLTANYQVATPVNWTDGDDVIITGGRQRRGSEDQVPEGLGRAEAVPAGHAPAEQVSERTGPTRPRSTAPGPRDGAPWRVRDLQVPVGVDRVAARPAPRSAGGTRSTCRSKPT